jgi:hypothetical protein
VLELFEEGPMKSSFPAFVDEVVRSISNHEKKEA